VTAAANPYRTERIEALAFRFQRGDWPGLLQALAAQRGRGAIVGAQGSGKTTLLEALARHLQTEGLRVRLVRMSTSDRRVRWSRLREVGAGDAVLVDGAEQLGPLTWLQLRARTRRAAVLVVTTHRPGRLPAVHHTATSPALLASLVHELLAGEARPAPSGAELAALFRRHDGNLREALLALYDTWPPPSSALVGLARARARV
jgi:energy-coupling factor transporter ATP-binding protein EcfA2